VADSSIEDIIVALGREINNSPSNKYVTITEKLAVETRKRLNELLREKDRSERQALHHSGQCPAVPNYYARTESPQPEPTPAPIVERPAPGPRLTHKEIGKMVEIVTTRYDSNGLLTDRVDTVTGVLQSIAVSGVDTRVWLQGHGDRVQIAYEDRADYTFTVLPFPGVV
jgi:hypothetical protein